MIFFISNLPLHVPLLKIYPTELENCEKFEKFEDFVQTFPISMGKVRCKTDSDKHIVGEFKVSTCAVTVLQCIVLLLETLQIQCHYTTNTPKLLSDSSTMYSVSTANTTNTILSLYYKHHKTVEWLTHLIVALSLSSFKS